MPHDGPEYHEPSEVEVTNVLTGERRTVTVTLAELSDAMSDSIDHCTGECWCPVETDGHCANGWPSFTEGCLYELGSW